jgi:hypothetical protein
VIKLTVVAVLVIALILMTVVGTAQADRTKTTAWNVQHYGMDYYYGFIMGNEARIHGGQYMNGQLSIAYAIGYSDGWHMEDDGYSCTAAQVELMGGCKP